MLITNGLSDENISNLNLLLDPENYFPIVGIQHFFFQQMSCEGKIWIVGPCFNLSDKIKANLSGESSESLIIFSTISSPLPLRKNNGELLSPLLTEADFDFEYLDQASYSPWKNNLFSEYQWEFNLGTYIRILTDEGMFDPNVHMKVKSIITTSNLRIKSIEGTTSFEVGSKSRFERLFQNT